ncbi:MAG: flagellar assembly protein FliW [Nitrospirae bacterium]|nr:flagellar assembly protein FliW [Nitrospirota bacterium]
MKIQTTRFGEVEIQDEKVITFPEGILGFTDNKEYVLIDHSPESPIRWLQSISEQDLAFVVMDPFLFKQDYKIFIQPDDIAILGTQEIENLLVLTIITIPPGHPEQMTANLKGPIVIHLKNRLAKQVVLYDAAYPTRFPIYENLRQGPPDPVAIEAKEILA